MLQTRTRAVSKPWTEKHIYQKLLKSGENFVRTSPDANNPQNLPKLPIPKLKDTFEKYIRSITPLLSCDELSKTQNIVKAFECSETAKKLQQHLEQRAKYNLNWLEDWWVDVNYLSFRSPLTIFSNPGQYISFENFKCDADRLAYTSKLILAAASYKMIIDSKKLPIDKQGKNELDMNQYNKIFGTCRIPCMSSDGLEFNKKSEHIIVAHKNHFFKLQLFQCGKPLSEKQILEQLTCIVSQSSEKAIPIGILSADHRDNWAVAYKDLLNGNEQSICDLQKSLFLVCLDDAMPGTDADYPNKQTKASNQLIHGGGSCANTGNRWFDKTVQFVIGCDGVVGLTYEHSPSEGQPIANMVDYLYKFIKKGGENTPDNPSNESAKKLRFEVNDAILNHIATAEKNLNKLIGNFDLECFKFEGYGKEFIKQQKLSPDSYIQMAMQYAFYKMYGFPAVHYESAATRKYVGGRTEGIRSCSIESVAFAKAMLNCNISDKSKAEALKAAIDSHKKYTVEANEGFGVDRHLLGLKLAAKEMGITTPDIFSDVGSTCSTHVRLKTSQVKTNCDSLMTYGPRPTADNGYCCCYNPRKDDINFGVSCFIDCPDTSSEKFKNCLIESLCDMQNVLTKTQKSKM